MRWYQNSEGHELIKMFNTTQQIRKSGKWKVNIYRKEELEHSNLLRWAIYLISCVTTFYLYSCDIFDKSYWEYYYIMIAFMVLIKVLSFKCNECFPVWNENKIRLVMITLISSYISSPLWQGATFILLPK